MYAYYIWIVLKGSDFYNMLSFKSGKAILRIISSLTFCLCLCAKYKVFEMIGIPILNSVDILDHWRCGSLAFHALSAWFFVFSYPMRTLSGFITDCPSKKQKHNPCLKHLLLNDHCSYFVKLPHILQITVDGWYCNCLRKIINEWRTPLKRSAFQGRKPWKVNMANLAEPGVRMLVFLHGSSKYFLHGDTM